MDVVQFDKFHTSRQATEMLLFNKKLTAVQACELGLVTEVFPDSSFQSEVWTRLKAYAKLPRNVSTHTHAHTLRTRLYCLLTSEIRRNSGAGWFESV